MRAWYVVVLLGGLLLAGCTGHKPLLSIETAVIDALPVVPFATKSGVSTAWLERDSSLVTVSHGIPRRELNGTALVSSMWVNYEVIASGDELAREWAYWEPANASLGQRQDWAKVKVAPPLPPSFLLPSAPQVAWSDQPPAVGEVLLLVGYTREENQLVRYWTQIEVIRVPAQHRALDAGQHVWFRTVSGKRLREGFSGAPLLRQRGDREFEVCAMMVSAQRDHDGTPRDVGVAIVVPKD